jgi:Tol biopolymer transport system component
MARDSVRLLLVVAGVLGAAFAGCGGGGGGGGTDFTDQLVLNRSDGIVQLDLATGDEHVLIAPPQNNILVEPAVSKDGTQIAYVGLLGAIVLPGQPTDLGTDLYVAASDGSNPRMVAEHAVRGEQLHSPVWLPDGDALIYAQRFENRQIVVDIERVDMTTGERTVVIRNGYAPGSSPDGTQVVFIRPEPDLTVSLWRANIDGTNEERLLADSDLVSFNTPRYSPDGRSIALGAAGPGESLRGLETPEALVSLQGGGVSSTHVDRMNGLPEDIWLIENRTMEATRLADLDLDQPSVAWSGDGQRLFALGDRGLYYIDLRGGGEEQIGEGMYHGQLDWLAAE